jgi:hypothetical protein
MRRLILFGAIAISHCGYALTLGSPGVTSLEVAWLTGHTGMHHMQVKEQGIASWYGPGFEGRATANGERFDTNQFTAAHKTLPFNSMVVVTRLDTRDKIVVRINDRGPFKPGRIIDLSPAAAKALELIEVGVTWVELEILPIREGQFPLIFDPDLGGYQVRSWQHVPGKLLVLSSSRHPFPVVVRVVGPELFGVGGGLLVSKQLSRLLGDDATILTD